MSPYRAALLALVVVGAAFASAPPAGATNGVDVTRDALGGTHDALDVTRDALGGTESQVDAADVADAADATTEERANVGDAQETDENDSANNSALGTDISSFMQSSVAETDGAVENGMWSAAFNGTENRSVRQQLVERRTGQLRTELAELRAEKEELIAEREAGNVSETAYKARVSRLAGRINALESSIDTTSSKARSVGADDEELATLRTEAKNLSGPEVSAVARNVSGVGVGNGNDGQGPPDGVGNGNDGNGNGPGAAGNGTASPPTDEINNSSDVGQRGPPSDRGNAPLADSATGDETPGGGAENRAAGQRAESDAPGRNGVSGRSEAASENGAAGHNGTPGPNGAPGHDAAPDQGPKALAFLTPTEVLDGSNGQAPADGFEVPVVSTVTLTATDAVVVGFSP